MLYAQLLDGPAQTASDAKTHDEAADRTGYAEQNHGHTDPPARALVRLPGLLHDLLILAGELLARLDHAMDGVIFRQAAQIGALASRGVFAPGLREFLLIISIFRLDDADQLFGLRIGRRRVFHFHQRRFKTLLVPVDEFQPFKLHGRPNGDGGLSQ